MSLRIRLICATAQLNPTPLEPKAAVVTFLLDSIEGKTTSIDKPHAFLVQSDCESFKCVLVILTHHSNLRVYHWLQSQ